MLGSKFTKFLSFLKQQIVFLQILHHSSVSWDITRLYYFSWNSVYFQQKESIKVQICWNFTWAGESLKFCTLLGSFYSNDIEFQLKKYRRVISHDIKNDAKFKEKLTFGFKYDMRNLVNFHPTTQKSQNFTLIGYFWPKYIGYIGKGIYVWANKNTEELSFMALKSDAKFE